MMSRKWLITLAAIAAIAAAAVIAGCGGKSSSLPDLSSMGDIHAIAREEGSGTRAQFENLIGSDEKNAAIAESTDEAIKKVSEDPDAIAYAAFSTVKQIDGVKILAVDGTAPSPETIRKDAYPLTRNYYLCWSGELSPAAQDFLTYIQGAGQAITGDYAIPLGNAETFLSDKSAGTVKIAGSSSMAPLMKALAEGYAKRNPNAKIDIEVTDSTDGINAAMEHRADLAMSSRDLKDYESELLNQAAVAHDGIAIIVSKQNPLTSLTKEEIKNIFNGTWSKWSDMK